ncbi:MAG: hypothetical protein GXP25_21080 [Planctomycetes bacterium]|nr:hypothetical protein [Planctomycetota bacterium]
MRRSVVKGSLVFLVLFLGCKPQQRGSRVFERASPLRQAAKRILDSERFPKPTKEERHTIQQQIKSLASAPRYESERVGIPLLRSRFRISCDILAEFGRCAVPFLLKAFDEERPTANLYFALALQQINPRIAGGIWRAMEGDHRNVPCMKGRKFYAVTMGEIARLRGEIPDRETTPKR